MSPSCSATSRPISPTRSSAHKAWVKAGSRSAGWLSPCRSPRLRGPGTLKNKTEFMLVDLFGKRTRVESKWQGGPAQSTRSLHRCSTSSTAGRRTPSSSSPGGGFVPEPCRGWSSKRGVSRRAHRQGHHRDDDVRRVRHLRYREGKTARWRPGQDPAGRCPEARQDPVRHQDDRHQPHGRLAHRHPLRMSLRWRGSAVSARRKKQHEEARGRHGGHRPGSQPGRLRVDQQGHQVATVRCSTTTPPTSTTSTGRASSARPG